MVIAVAERLNKADAIYTAFKGKLINGLIVDEAVAKIILATE